MKEKSIEDMSRMGCFSMLAAVFLFAGSIFSYCLWFGLMYTGVSPLWKAAIFGLAALMFFFSVVAFVFGYAAIQVAKDEKEGIQENKKQ